jgi:hypothetical protein
MNDFQKAQRHNVNARVRQIDQAIKALRSTIDRVGQAREMPGVSIATFEAEVEKLIAEKVELTAGLELHDAVETEAVVPDNKPAQDSAVENAKALERHGSQPFQKPAKNMGTYKYEELFHENIDGDIILTFPDDIIEATGWKEGDTLDFEVIAGNLHIKKRVDVSKLK